MKRGLRSLTLVELLIAVALGTILTGIITFVWLQSNRIFTSTVNRLETYQRLRVLLDSVERDLSNTARTTNMEYYDDVNADGSYNTGDSLITVGPPTGAPLTAGAPGYRTPREASDPLVIIGDLNEFNEVDDPGFNAFEYFFGPLVFSPGPYAITVEDYLTDRFYWRDEVMVRTFALADGLNRPAMVHYRLVQPAAGTRSVLRRRVWYLDEGGRMVNPVTDAPGTDRTSLLANDVCDFKVAFFFKQSASSQTGSSQANGYWYHVGHPLAGTAPEQALISMDREQGYYDALTGNGGGLVPALSGQHIQRRQFIPIATPDAPTGANFNAVSFFYQGVARVELDQGRALIRTIGSLTSPQPTSSSAVYGAAAYGWGGTAKPAADNPVSTIPAFTGSARANLGYDAAPQNTYTNFGFPGVRPGDKIYLYEATDDDASWKRTVQTLDVNGDTILNDLSPDATGGLIFPDQEYTVEVISSDGSQNYIALRLAEPINFFRLRRHWLQIEPPYNISIPGYAPDTTWTAAQAMPANPHGPNRSVTASFNVRYRVGFLPAAFRVRLSIDDKYNRKVLPMERVIRLLQH